MATVAHRLGAFFARRSERPLTLESGIRPKAGKGQRRGRPTEFAIARNAPFGRGDWTRDEWPLVVAANSGRANTALDFRIGVKVSVLMAYFLSNGLAIDVFSGRNTAAAAKAYTC